MTAMKNLPLLMLMLMLLCSIMAQGADVTTVIERIEDGDTVVARIDGNPERLQLLGIDAPEDTDNAKFQRDLQVTGLQPEVLLQLGEQATQHVRTLLVPGQGVRISGELQRRDRYGRIPVMLYAAGERSVNEAMVGDGYALILRRYPLDAQLNIRLEALEAEAITGHRGLWGSYRESAAAWSGKKLGD